MDERDAVLTVAMVLVLILGLVIFWPKIQEATGPNPISQTLENCEKNGAAYRSFTDSCMDSCRKQRNPELACAAVLTTGCDCGQGKCWNGFECEPN